MLTRRAFSPRHVFLVRPLNALVPRCLLLLVCALLLLVCFPLFDTSFATIYPLPAHTLALTSTQPPNPGTDNCAISLRTQCLFFCILFSFTCHFYSACFSFDSILLLFFGFGGGIFLCSLLVWLPPPNPFDCAFICSYPPPFLLLAFTVLPLSLSLSLSLSFRVAMPRCHPSSPRTYTRSRRWRGDSP